MTSWEQVINEVVIPGDPGAIRSAKGIWEDALARVADAKRYLDDGLTDLASWEGAAGEAYRTTIGDIAKKLRTFGEDYEAMPGTLGTAATQLDTARSQIPVPDSMMDDVGGAALLFSQTGMLQTLAVGDIFNSLKQDFSITGLRDGAGNALSGMANLASHVPLVGGMAHDALDGLRDWVSTQDDKAVQLYNQLNGQYAGTAADVPAGTVTPGRQDLNPTAIPPGGMPHGGSPPGMPHLGSPGGMPPGGFNPTTGSSGLSGLDSGALDPSVGDFSGDPPSTGLAGAGGGLSGIGSGGLGPAGGLGAGGLGAGGLGSGGGLGAGGLGAGAGRFPGMGTPVSPMMGMGAGGGAGGRSGGRGAGRGAGGRTGMMGAPYGHGSGQGSEDDHGTWLQEDEDVWGTDNDAAPPLLT